MAPEIVVISKEGKRLVCALDKPKFSIGRDDDCDLPLRFKSVSGRHCEILVDKGKAFIQDLNSTNGTFVENNRIVNPVQLYNGMRAKVGDFTIEFRGGEDRPAQAAEAPAAASAGAASAPGRPSRPAAPSVAGAIPPELKRKIHERLIEELDLKHFDFSKKSEAEIRQRTKDTVVSILTDMAAEIPSFVNQDRLLKEILDEALGLGPLEDLLADPDIEEIMVNNWDRVYVARKGKIVLSDKRFLDNRQVLAVIERIVAPIGRRIDESSPMVDARLKDGSRVNAIIPPLALSGPCLTIRRFSATPLQVKDLVDRFHSLTAGMGEFLQLCVKNRKNILISGGTGSGKTTLLNVISGYIPHDERIVTIEDSAELRLPQEHVVSLESRPPNIEGKGQIPIQKLVVNALRMRPDRIVVGECRSGEALDMLQAMNTGHDGSMTTVHANTPRDSLSRVETMVMMAGMELPAKAIRQQVASAINLIVQIARLADGTRKITHITEVSGMEQDIITLQDIFVFEQTGFSKDGKVVGAHRPTGAIPNFIHDLRRRGIDINMAIFS